MGKRRVLGGVGGGQGITPTLGGVHLSMCDFVFSFWICGLVIVLKAILYNRFWTRLYTPSLKIPTRWFSLPIL